MKSFLQFLMVRLSPRQYRKPSRCIWPIKDAGWPRLRQSVKFQAAARSPGNRREQAGLGPAQSAHPYGSALNEKNSTGDILVLEKLEITKPKTKEIKTILDNLKIKEKTLLVLPRADHNLKLAIKNMVHVESALAQGLNALDCLKAKKIIFTKEALGLLNKRLENN